MTVDFKTIGKRIKSHRKSRNMTQAELAERVGLSNVYISYIETGGKRTISLEALLRIVNEFDISFDSLVLEESMWKVPKIYREFAELLADCGAHERADILETASAYKKLRRTETN